METIIVLLVTVLIGLTAFFAVKSLLSNSTSKGRDLQARGLNREEIKEKFRHLNSMATQVRI